MKVLKILKSIIIIPIAIALFALLYVFLLLGENDDKSIAISSLNKSTSQIKNLNLNNSTFDNILNEFKSPMLIKGEIPSKLDLQCKGSNNNYTHILKAYYTTQNGTNYSITAIKPLTSISSLNLSNYNLIKSNSFTIAGMQALWFQSKSDIKICLNNENVNYIVTMPITHQEDILTELAKLSLSK